VLQPLANMASSFLARVRRSREFARRVQRRAESILERLERPPDPLVILSNAIDPLRPESRTDQRIHELEHAFDVIFWCLFDECPHEDDSRCPQPPGEWESCGAASGARENLLNKLRHVHAIQFHILLDCKTPT
jgi:transposase